MSRLTTSIFKRRVIVMAVLASLGSAAFALPVDGVVTNGAAAITSGGTGVLVVNQTSNAATINWQSFSIGASETVRFVQPSSNSVALNRVLGSDPSQILGKLSANGQVFLVNPNGILFGQGASVNVGGLVASTLDMADSDFLAGRYSLQGSASSSIRNLGAIHAREGGYVALVGQTVENEGNISAPKGSVALVAGSAVTLDFAGDGLLKVAVSESALNALVRNGGVVQADGGAVWMSASARDALLSTVIDNTGIVQAHTVGNRNGRIYLDGGESGVVSVGGTLQAAGTAAGTTGGSITVSGDKVAVNDGALLDATGHAGGGTIAVGGGWQGKDPDIRQASAVYIARGATLDASATSTGDGGTIVAWSDVFKPGGSTRVYGTLRARGGALSGNGGRIETSGHWLDVQGMRLDAAAPNGNGGTWLLDPEDLTIGALPTDAMFIPPGPFAIFASGPGTPNVLNTDIETQLNLGVSVVLQTAPTGTGAGNITVNANVAKTGGGDAALTLQAIGGIALANGVSISSSSGALDVNLLAGGGISLGAGSSISSNGGAIVLAGASLSNNAGAGVFNTAGGRWLVYTNSPLNDSVGGLNSGNVAIYGQDPGSLPPPSVVPGNRFIYASANPTTAVNQTLAAMQSGLVAPPPTTGITAAPPLLLAFDPPDWLFRSVEEGGLAILQTSSTGSPVLTMGGAPATVAAAGATGGNVAPGPVAGGATAPTSRLRSSGFSGGARPVTASPPAVAPRPSLEAFLKGAAQSLQVGASSSGAVLLATLSGLGKPLVMTVAVAPGEGFRVNLPRQFLQTLQSNGGTTTLQARVGGGPLPAWLRLDRATASLSASAVPANSLPLTVRLVSPNGKFADVVFQ
ncbi:MAG: filamentous hemagglutinin N-terminal domain-containing protein [Rhodoferax sp.]|uniref:two-partner secretion domain-containing protein n=1 Tax=Rhodoferax sp. TaxID=50421 RepID=UPI002ACE1630|nr:filamentous hemagglutinin N-terminal domain-containing protein [Rhodoferax sp.]MDZ7891223.1 filamentous hemagglutinin N-terminal domain-containing protein [Rhodoferax sp.]